MTELSVTENIIKYRAFIADILVPRLKDAKDRKSVVASEVDEYRKFELKVIEMQKSFPEDFQTLVDLGRGCQVRAAVPPSETIFMNVGLGVFVEIPMTGAYDIVYYSSDMRATACSCW